MRAPVIIVLAFGLAFPVLAFAEDPPKLSTVGASKDVSAHSGRSVLSKILRQLG
jgi:hypothetical protein